MTEGTVREVSIVSFQTVLDAIDKTSNYHTSAKLFFATLANESAKNFTIRKHYAFIPKPVFSLLFEIIWELYGEYERAGNADQKLKEHIDIIQTILAGVEMDKFELDQAPLDSVMEFGRLIADEANTNINLVCNEPSAKATKDGLKTNGQGKKYEFEPKTTEEWVVTHLTM